MGVFLTIIKKVSIMLVHVYSTHVTAINDIDELLTKHKRYKIHDLNITEKEIKFKIRADNGSLLWIHSNIVRFNASILM